MMSTLNRSVRSGGKSPSAGSDAGDKSPKDVTMKGGSDDEEGDTGSKKGNDEAMSGVEEGDKSDKVRPSSSWNITRTRLRAEYSRDNYQVAFKLRL